ncbi:MAG: porin family protein [Muribaculaceae bacterium]|nr:porin family protein [Muribaculaceae bacterium]
MKSIKFLAFLLTIITFASNSTLSASEPQLPRKTLGILAGYDTRNHSAEAGIFFQYRASKIVRIAPDLTYIARRKGTDALAINLNVHFPFAVSKSGRVNVYPLAGINYTSWNYHPGKMARSTDETDDVTRRDNKFGLNLGGGIDVLITSTLKLRFEGKWVGAKHTSTGDFAVGIGYAF